MSQHHQATAYRRFRARCKSHLRDNKLLIALELCVAVLIWGAYLADFLPLSEVPYLLVWGWLSLWVRGVGWRGVGLRRPARWGWALALGVVAGVAFQFFGTYVLEPLIVRLVGQPVDLSQFASVRGNVSVLLILLALVWTFAAFGEEFVYRGYLMSRVAELAGGSNMAWALSLVVVSVLFGVGHLYQGASGILVNTAAGLAYGAVYLRAGRNLWAPVIAHGVYDTVGLAFLFWGIGV
jgi:membrane protease YdiL (CAAX protease family)